MDFNRYYPPIDTVRELYLSGLPWTADHEAWVKNLRDADEPYIKSLLRKFEIHNQNTLARLSKKGGYGFTVELTNGGKILRFYLNIDRKQYVLMDRYFAQTKSFTAYH